MTTPLAADATLCLARMLRELVSDDDAAAVLADIAAKIRDELAAGYLGTLEALAETEGARGHDDRADALRSALAALRGETRDGEA